MKTITDGTAQFIVRDKRIQTLIDLFYPVGSVYITADSGIEEADLPFMQYGTWEELPSGVCLQTVIGGKEVGSTVGAGLPNITGIFKVGGTTGGVAETSGCFYYSNAPKGYAQPTGSTHPNVGWGKFDASRSNNIYGNSNTVQPPAIMVRAWKRTA